MATIFSGKVRKIKIYEQPAGFEYRAQLLAECMESRSRAREVGLVCKVVAIALPVMTLLVMYVNNGTELFREIGCLSGWLSSSQLVRQTFITHGAM